MSSKPNKHAAHYQRIRESGFIRLTLGDATDQVVDAAEARGVTVHDLLRSSLAATEAISKLNTVKNGGRRIPRDVMELLEKQDRER